MCHKFPLQFKAASEEMGLRYKSCYNEMALLMTEQEKIWISNYSRLDTEVRELRKRGSRLKKVFFNHVEELQLKAIDLEEKNEATRNEKIANFHKQASKRKTTVGATVDRIKKAEKSSSTNMIAPTAEENTSSSNWFFDRSLNLLLFKIVFLHHDI
jgi:hypothetical protein